MTQRISRKLDFGRKLLLATMGAAVVAGPVLVGIVNAPRLRAQARSGVAAVPAFDAASVRRRPFGAKPGANRRMQIGPDSITYEDVSLSACIQAAYGIKSYQISGPDWLEIERYDIIAKAAGPVPEQQIKLMLQALLADRFKLAIHRDKKELPVYAMVVGKNGPKFHESAGEGKSGVIPDGGSMAFKNYSMQALADFLARPADRPVLDKTGLAGQYDFSVRLLDSPPENIGLLKRAAADWQTMFTDLPEQLGLKLEAQKAAVEILVVDRAEKVPTEN